MKNYSYSALEQAAYLSDLSFKDKVWDKHRANSDIVRDMYQVLGNGKYSLRMTKCSRLLEFALKKDFQDDSLFKLLTAKFCRIRFCPVCQWRRSLMWKSRFFSVVPSICADYSKHRFLFLTLTVRNCEVNELRKTVDWMNQAWRKLEKRKIFPGIGWVKSIEVTRSQDSKAHPHFHCILIVPDNYFWGKQYLSKDKWIKLWQKSLKIGYEPSVKVNKVKLKSSRQKKLIEELGRDLTEDELISYALVECFKYSVKEADLISDLQWLDAVTKQLHKTRAISLGGIFKEYLSEDEPRDLIYTDLGDDIEILETDAKFLFGWRERVKRYQSM